MHDGLGNRIRVTINMISKTNLIPKATYNILEIYDLDDKLPREFRHFNLREQRVIEAIAMGLTSQFAGEDPLIVQLTEPKLE